MQDAILVKGADHFLGWRCLQWSAPQLLPAPLDFLVEASDAVLGFKLHLLDRGVIGLRGHGLVEQRCSIGTSLVTRPSRGVVHQGCILVNRSLGRYAEGSEFRVIG